MARAPDSTLVDRVKIYAISSGTGPFTLGAPVRSYRGVETLVDGDTYSYAAENGGQFEVGRGEFLASLNRLTRRPTASSNGGDVVDFMTDTQIAFTALASDLSVVSAYVDAALAVGFETWDELLAFAPNLRTGDRTFVSSNDTGDHADPSSGGQVPNAGVYEKFEGEDQPIWIYATLENQAAQAAQAALAAIPGVMQPYVDEAQTIVDGIPAAVQPYLNTAAASASAALASQNQAALSEYLASNPFANTTALNAYVNAALMVGDSTIIPGDGRYAVTSLSPLTWTRTGDSDGKVAGDGAASATATANSLGTAATRSKATDAATQSNTYSRSAYTESGVVANGAGTRGEQAFALDAGVDIAVGTIVDAIAMEITVAATAVKLRVRAWEVATNDANVNSPPPQANDVLISDMLFTDLAAIQAINDDPGVTFGAVGKMLIFPTSNPFTIKFLKTTKASVLALDANDVPVQVAIGLTLVTSTGRQRRSGWYRSPANGGSFSNNPLTNIQATGFLTRNRASALANETNITANATAVGRLPLPTLGQIADANDSSLLAQVAAYGKAITGIYGIFGDSIANADQGDATWAPEDMISDFLAMSGGTVNFGVNGTRTERIRATLLARPSAELDHGVIVASGNNFYTYALGTSGLASVIITNGGSGGADGTYPFSVSGGATSVDFIAPTGTVTVSGGSITAVNITQRGGGYRTIVGGTGGNAPMTISVTVPGLTGAVLTPVYDILGTALADMADMMTACGPNKLIMSDWSAPDTRYNGFPWHRENVKQLKAAYGGRAIDGLALLAQFHDGSKTDTDAVQMGNIPPSLVDPADGTRNHPIPHGRAYLWNEIFRMSRARAGIGGPYIHPNEPLGYKPGDAAGVAIGTLRTLGTPLGFRIAGATTPDIARISPTGVITRGAASPALGGPQELVIQATGKKGKSNLARQPLVPQMSGTFPQSIVRLRGTNGQFLRRHKMEGVVPNKRYSFVACLRLYDRKNDLNVNPQRIIRSVSNRGANWDQVSMTGRIFTFAPNYDNLTTGEITSAGNYATPRLTNTADFFMLFFSIDTTTGVQTVRIGFNETITSPAASVADALISHDVGRVLFGASSLAQLAKMDFKFMWEAADYIDFSDPAKRALFYDSSTGAPKDLGAAGVVGGVTPYSYLRGMSGDYGLGKNYGTGGDYHPSTYIDRENFGFVDMAS